MTDLLALSVFVPLIGQKFQFSSGNHDMEELELIEANALPVHNHAPRKDPFSLVFRADKECSLWQGTIPLKHTAIGSNNFFLVPIGEDEQGMYFSSLFN